MVVIGLFERSTREKFAWMGVESTFQAVTNLAKYLFFFETFRPCRKDLLSIQLESPQVGV
jgi:hypothetical protein